MNITLDKKLQGFRQIAKEKLQNILCSIPDNQKDLIIETCLIKPLEHICGASWLRSKGINKIYKFDSKNPPQRRSTIVYFISSNLITFKDVLDQINAINLHQHTEKQFSDIVTKPFHCIVVPDVLTSFIVLLEEEGLFGHVELHRFNWDFISIDTGVFSLEMPQLFKEVFIRGETSLLPSVAHSLRILNFVCRNPSIIITIGENASKVANMIDQIEELKNTTTSEENSDFNVMVIMDRSKDYASALLTPVIYSGLLLEIFRSVAGTLQIEEHKNRIQSEKLHFLKKNPKKDKTNEKGTVTNLRLNDSVDGIYIENRYKHFADAISLLSSHAKALGMEGKNIHDMEISEMNDFVMKKLPKVASQKKELFKHLLLCENIVNYYDVNELGGNFEMLQMLQESMLYNQNKKQTFQKILELLTTDAHRCISLRFIALLYLTCGLNSEEASTFMTNYLNSFGYQNLPIFSHLSTAKLFPDLSSLSKTKILTNIASISLPKWQNTFQIESNRMKLLPANNSTIEQTINVNAKKSEDRNPTDPSYVFNGSYIPLIAQLTNSLCNASKIDDFADKFGQSEHILFHRCFKQHLKLNTKDLLATIKKGEVLDIFPLKPRKIFCFMLGGITYGELGAISFVEKNTGSKIVVASDCVSSGNDFISAAFL